MTTYDELITRGFDDDFYDGTGQVASDVPDVWDIGLNGRGYMLDTDHPAFGGQSAYLGRMGLETIPYIRNQADSSDEPGRATVNPDDLWTRAQSSWHHGAGQQYYDLNDPNYQSDRDRYWQSFGVDPWTVGQLNVLNQTTSIYASTNANLQVVRAGTYLYLADNQTLKYANTPYSSWTSSTNAPGQTITSICSDGHTVYAACGSAGIYTGVVGTNASDAHYNTTACSLIAYVNDRLMIANGSAIHNVTSGTGTAWDFSAPNSAFTWVGFAPGQTCIYAAGYAGDRSLVYRIGIKSDGTGLDAAIIAGELPHGEIVYSIVGYLGYVLVGTNAGLRLATTDSAGNLTFGALITTNAPCRAFEPHDRFVWFGWDDYDTSNTGLGRADLSVVDAVGAPAYSSDLMCAHQGEITSITTDSNNLRVYSVQGTGLFIEHANTPVTTAWIDSGYIDYGLVANKIALRMAVKHKALTVGQSISFGVYPDDQSLISIGSSNLVGSINTDPALAIPEVSAVLFQVHMTLTGGPTLEHWEFRAYPTAPRGSEVHVPIRLHEVVIDATGQEVYFDVGREYDFIQSCVGIGNLISYQEMGKTFSALVEDVNFQRQFPTSNRQWWNGTMLLVLKVLGT